jgi:hypothetical protein
MASARPSDQPLLVSKARAAELLSISIDTFERLVMPEVRTVRIGRRVLFAVPDLSRWVNEHAAMPLSAELRQHDACGGRQYGSLPARRGAMVRRNIKRGPARREPRRSLHLGGPQDAP